MISRVSICMRYASLIFLLAFGCLAQPIEQPYRFTRDKAPQQFSAAEGAYWGSVAFLAAGHIADHRSSIGQRELNPFLRGTAGQYDSGRGALIKAAIVGGNVIAQRLLIRRHPRLRKWATGANLVWGGASFAIAARNQRQR